MNKAALVALFVVLAVSLSVGVYVPAKDQRKQLQGPPSEFSQFVDPSPADAAQTSESALIPVHLTQNGDVWEWTSTIPVDSSEELSAALLSPHKDQLKVYLQPPTEDTYTLLVESMFSGEGTLGLKSSGPFGIDGASVNSTTYTFLAPATGDWKVKIVSQHKLPVVKSAAYAYRFANSVEQPQAYILISNKSPYKLVSHLNSYRLEQGQQVGVVVQINHNELSDEATFIPAQDAIITEAVLDVILPNGEETQITMHDDGLHADGLANDGVYAATLQASSSGDYLARAVVGGKTTTGLSFYRTTQHLITVAPIESTLGNKAVVTVDTISKMATFAIDVTVATAKEMRAYAEIYGTNAQQQQVPIGWASSISPLAKSNGNGQYVVELSIHTQWIVNAAAKAPFTLKNVELQDVDTFVVLSTAAKIPVQGSSTALDLLLNSSLPTATSEVSEEMRFGPRPKSLIRSAANVSESSGKLLLVHGYCSGPVWDVKDFTNAVVLEDYSKTRSNDEFARLILEFGLPYNSYGIVAHSQGGLASLHLKTYYWSGLDALTKGRPIQTVGSPYRGCSLAGILADLGWLFGLGCGSNFDLSRDGANLWYSKIPKNVGGPQSSVYYYTTRYVNNWWFFSNCVTASNLVLSKPNDGTCELKYAMLDNGNGQSTTEGWCHATGMKYPPQTSDPTRNKEMNMYAGR